MALTLEPIIIREMDLESQRVNILTSIQQLERISTAEQRKTVLPRFKQEYNQIIDALNYQKRGNTRLDPLVKFPPEIWISIMQKAISQPHILQKGYSLRLTTLCNCVLVSKRWYQYITGAPTLWTNIDLNDDRTSGQDTAILLATFLHLSQDYRLDISICIPFKSWELVCDRVTIHRSRINSIGFYYSDFSTGKGGYNNEINDILRSLSPLDCLTRLWGVPDDVQWLLEESSSLRFIGLNSLSLNALSSQGAQNLRRFYTTEDIRSVIALVKSFPRAQDVQFFSMRPHRETHTNDIPFIGPQDIEFTESMTLDWMSLDYRQHHIHFPVWLLTKLPNLVKLRLDLWSVQLVSLFKTISCLSSLRHLSVEINWSRTFPDLPLETTPPCSSLYRLDIYDWGDSPYDTTEYYTRLFKVLVKIFNNVDYFVIQGGNIGPTYLSIKADGFQKLQYLCIEIYKARSPELPLLEGKAWFPTSLQELSITTLDFTCIQIHSPTIEILDLLRNLDYNIKQELSISEWPNLQRLRVNIGNIIFRNAIHQNLRDVRLISGNIPDDTYTSFCRDLALYPYNLPSLQSIALYQVPEWDIFFIMLERKNFCIEPGVARITRVHLPDSYPKRLLKPLKDLLSGIYTERPSNLDLSVVGNVEIIFDTSILGCVACHRALQLCTLEWNISQRADKLGLSPPPPPYPDNPQDILLTWDERAAWWREVGRSGFGRGETCYPNRGFHGDWIVSHEDDECIENPWT